MYKHFLLLRLHGHYRRLYTLQYNKKMLEQS